jgi:biotin-dependent carboxylase-like uncharacterized protein
MGVKVRNPGLLTTVQDLGRPGYFHLGIPLSGAMDRLALKAANLLVGNPQGAAALEAVFIGPELVFSSDTVIAVTGADMPVKIDGAGQPSWTALTVNAGQTLSFDYLKSGARIYIAFAGGIDVPAVLGSRSTYVIGALGGFNGRPLAAGDEFPLGSAVKLGFGGALRRSLGLGDKTAAGKSLPAALRPSSPLPAKIRVLPGLYWDRLTESAKQSFFVDQWKVAPEADRMGYRFRGGRALEFVSREPPFGAGSDPSNIVDACYPYGSIQVPGGSEPIILHRDAVSGGGYFMLGTVISADMDLIGQLQPNTPTQFVEVDMDTALKAGSERAALIEQIRNSLQ